MTVYSFFLAKPSVEIIILVVDGWTKKGTLDYHQVWHISNAINLIQIFLIKLMMMVIRSYNSAIKFHLSSFTFVEQYI